MRKERSLGLDELIIVNPGPIPGGAGLQPGQVFFGDDGRLYQVRLAGAPVGSRPPRRRLPSRRPTRLPATLYLGADGDLYQLY